jgi:hypothetical protein
VLLPDVHAVDVVEIAVPGLGHDREAAVEHLADPGAAPLDDRVPHHTHAVGVGDDDRVEQQAVVVDPGRAGHLAVAVQVEPAGEHRREVAGAARKHRGDPGPDVAPPDQGGVADRHAGDVGNGVERSRLPLERNAHISGALGAALRRQRGGEEGQQQGPQPAAHAGARKMKYTAPMRQSAAHR